MPRHLLASIEKMPSSRDSALSGHPLTHVMHPEHSHEAVILTPGSMISTPEPASRMSLSQTRSTEASARSSRYPSSPCSDSTRL